MVKKYRFDVYDESLQNFIDTKSNISEFVRSILDDYRTGKLSYSDGDDKPLKDEKLEQEVLQLKLKNQLTLRTQENKSLKEIEEIMKNPSLFKVSENTDGLKCPECSWHTLQQTLTTSKSIRLYGT